MKEKPDPAVSHYEKNVSEKDQKALEEKEHSEHQIGPEREKTQQSAARTAQK